MNTSTNYDPVRKGVSQTGSSGESSDPYSMSSQSPLYGGARGAAIRILSRIEQSDSYLDKVLEKELDTTELNNLDKALLTEIVHGVVRWQSKLDWILTGFYHGEFTKCITPVKNAMRIALYQIMFLDKIPAFAAVNESVEIIKRIKGVRSANVVNAVLRNILHHLNDIRYPLKEEDPARYLSVMYAHPQWMVRRWIEQFGEEQTEALLEANNRRPQLTLRINTTRTSVKDFHTLLREKNVSFRLSPYEEYCIHLQYIHNIQQSESFKNGLFSIQDASASLVARLANPQPNQLVYDLCAAPGGKTSFLAELMNDTGIIIALDKYDAKLRFIHTAAARLHLLSIQTMAADARKFSPDQQADLVLVDAPCSGTGTLAKKPDIKWKRELEDIHQMTTLQKEILTNAARLVRPGGVLVYSTCSIEPEENMRMIEWFLSHHSEFVKDSAEHYLHPDICKNGYLQTFPHIHQMDGAFAARLIKRSDNEP